MLEPEPCTSSPESEEEDCRHEEHTSGHPIKRQPHRSRGSSTRGSRSVERESIEQAGDVIEARRVGHDKPDLPKPPWATLP
jgi:hypothetical protein